MKKVIAIMLVFIMIFSFAGCSGSQNTEETDNPDTVSPTAATSTADDNLQAEDNTLQPEDGAKLVIWEDNEDRIKFIEYVAEKFKEKYGIDVEIEEVFSGDVFNRLVQDAPAGLGPDLFEGPHDSLGTVIAAGLVQPNDNSAEQIKNEFIESAVNCVTYDGQVYGYPLSVSTYALIYNKALVSTPAQTFQEIIDFAKTYNSPDDNKYAFMWDVDNVYLTHCILAGYGAYVFGDNGSNKDDIGLNTDDAVEGAKFFHSLKDILDVKSADADSQMIDGLFTSGKIPYTISGQWSVTSYTNAGIDVGVAPLPKLPNGNTPLSFLGVQGLYISAYSNYPNAAKLFAEMASSEEMLLKRYEMTHEIPPVKSLMDSDTIKADPVSSVFLQQAQSSTVMPFIPQMSLVWDPYMRALQSIWDLDTDPKTAMDECVEIIKSSIATQQ
jgi:arabinogalactan oligomer/maltooligosaccharide transport system substrate-binding protein